LQRPPVAQTGQRIVMGQVGQLRALAVELGVQVGHSLGRGQPHLQVEQVNRLDEVVVGARLHTPHHVLAVAQGRDQDDVGVAGAGVGPDPAAQLQPIDPGHQQIRDQQVRSGLSWL
jgi:hypothetical protein